MRSADSSLALSLTLVLLGACGGGGAPNGGVPKCTPGASVECACPTGENGAQICGTDGKFGACSCMPGGAAGTRAPVTSTGAAGIGGTTTSGAPGGAGGTTSPGSGGISGGFCVGTASPCGVHTDNTDCAVVGCRWKVDECSGTPLPCPSPGSSSTCASIAGCFWSSLSSTCSGTPVSCATRTEHTVCVNQGCTWAPAACTGTAPSCGEFPNQFSCNYAGCTWQPGAVGTPASGGALSTGITATGGAGSRTQGPSFPPLRFPPAGR